MKNKAVLILVIFFVLSVQNIFAAKKQGATIFKCINSKGDIYYNDKPCPVNNKETRMRAVKDPQGVPPAINNNSFSSSFVKKGKKKINSGITNRKENIKFRNEKDSVPKELEGERQTLEAQLRRKESRRMSKADKRRARRNDRYNNTPIGSR